MTALFKFIGWLWFWHRPCYLRTVKGLPVEQRNGEAVCSQSLLMAHADKTLDITGLVQPRPAIVIETTMGQLGPGQVLSVITNDAAARESVQALCAERGYALLETTREGGTFHFTIRKGITATAAALPQGERRGGKHG